jgi:hypothetical protein
MASNELGDGRVVSGLDALKEFLLFLARQTCR